MNVYIVAHTSGTYMFPASHRVFKTEKGVIKEYKKLHEQGIREIFVIKKVEADPRYKSYTREERDE